MTLDPANDVLLETDLDVKDDDEVDDELEERIRRAVENARSVGQDLEEPPASENDTS